MARREDYDIVLRATDQTALAFAAAKRNVESINGAIGTLKVGLTSVAGLLGVQITTDWVKQNVSALAEIGSKAKTVGVTTDALQALRFEARQSGADVSVVEHALDRFSDAASKAGTGGNYLTKVFQANGVPLKDQNGLLRSASDLLVDYARMVANAQSPQDRIRLAVEAFGKQAGPQMVEVLERIAQVGLPGVISRARELGAVVGSELIEKADVVDKRWKQMADTMEVRVKSALIGLIDTVQGFVEKINAADAIERGTYNLQQLAYAIALARSKGSPVDPTWIKEFERLAELQREVNRGRRSGEEVSPLGKPTILPNTNSDALQKSIDTISKHIAVMEADARTVDATAGAHEALRVRTQLLELAQQHGIPVAGEYANKISDLEARARGAADALAAAKLRSDVLFDRSQLGRTASEQVVAEKLRSARIDANSATGQQIASEIRLNEALKDTKALADDALKGMIADMRAGKNGAEVLAGVLDKVATKLSNLAIDNLLSAVFRPASGAGGGGIFASIGKLFGFAEGGEFKVGGAGGTDSQIVAFRASPDETVSVRTPSQRSARSSGEGIIIHVVNHNDFRGSDPGSEARIKAYIDRQNQAMVPTLIQAVARAKSNNPAYLK